jgi:hypothetical protein
MLRAALRSPPNSPIFRTANSQAAQHNRHRRCCLPCPRGDMSDCHTHSTEHARATFAFADIEASDHQLAIRLDDDADRGGPPDFRLHGQVEVALRPCERYSSHSKDNAPKAHSKVSLRKAHRRASREIARRRGRDVYRAVDFDTADLARPSHTNQSTERRRMRCRGTCLTAACSTASIANFRSSGRV